MATQAAIPRNLLIFGIVLPVAVVLGYVLTDPFATDSVAILAAVLGVLLIPVFLRWHQPLLLFSVNSGISIFLLPGQPEAWMLLAGISLGVTILTCVLDKKHEFLRVNSVGFSLLALALVVLVTAKFTGGMGVRSLGGAVYGGKKYYYTLFAIMAFFAVSSQRIPREKVPLYLGLFLLSQLLLACSNLIYLAGESFYWLYLFFPVDYAVSQAVGDMSVESSYSRLSGVGFAAVGGFLFMQMKYGIRGIFDYRKPWRLALWCGIIFLGTLGGFRSVLVIFFLVFVIQYYYERLFRSGLTVALGVLMVAGMVVTAFFSTKLPGTVQRAISFLPVEVDPVARADAQASIDWRLQMWSYLLPEIPRHFWLGKGYAASPADYALAYEAWRRGLGESIELRLIAGDYHNGPLSVQVPFGIWGTLAFVAFVVSGFRVLYNNYRYGDEDLRLVNTFLLSVFVAKVVFFTVFFGAISGDLVVLASYVGVGIAVNGGMRRSPKVEREAEEQARLLAPVS